MMFEYFRLFPKPACKLWKSGTIAVAYKLFQIFINWLNV